MWADASARLGAVRRAMAVGEGGAAAGGTGRAVGGEPGAGVRPLALALARHTVVACRALDRRDPAVLVRYVDELAARALAGSLQWADPALLATFGRVVRRCLALLDVDPVMPGA